tara:strand:- start:23526 stop:24047 length:522 start_codon:yes stop_codon:yes gene_type:complete
VNVALCREDGIYHAGGPLQATWQISRVPVEQIQGVEISVMWHTEGKGDEDLHVHHFHRISESQIRRTGLADQQSIQCQLPRTPLSYHGRLIRLQWCIRLRLFMASGKEIVAEQPFYLVAGSRKQCSPLKETKLASPTIQAADDAQPVGEDGHSDVPEGSSTAASRSSAAASES